MRSVNHLVRYKSDDGAQYGASDSGASIGQGPISRQIGMNESQYVIVLNLDPVRGIIVRADDTRAIT